MVGIVDETFCAVFEYGRCLFLFPYVVDAWTATSTL